METRFDIMFEAPNDVSTSEIFTMVNRLGAAGKRALPGYIACAFPLKLRGANEPKHLECTIDADVKDGDTMFSLNRLREELLEAAPRGCPVHVSIHRKK